MIRQLHYTSCERGRDRIQGFQVAAATPGIPRRHEDLALPLAAFRPPPSAAAVPSAAEIAAMPVALGFRDFGEVAVLFRSHYLGQDFTGRQGNYFAHVLLADRPASDLGTVVPAATWEAAFWSREPRPAADDVTLPAVDRIAPGRALPVVDDSTLTALLAAAREGLAGRVRQIVVVGRWPHPDVDVAAAVLAVTSALPRHLARRLSFTTYTARPQDVDVLVAGTSPDVPLGADSARDRLVLRLGEPAPGPEPAFAALVRRRRADPAAVAAVVALGGEVHPPVQPDELDALAAAVDLLDGTDPDADPLPGLEFLADRHRAALGPEVWARVERQVAAGVLTVVELERWSAVLGRSPGHRPVLDGAYLRSALTRLATDAGADGLWLPDPAPGSADGIAAQAIAAVEHDPRPATAAHTLRTLARLGIEPADADLGRISDFVLLPLVLDPEGDVAPFRQLPVAPRLAAVMARQLEERLDDDLVGTAAEGMTVDDARWLAAAARPGGRVALATALRLAAAGEGDGAELVARHASDAAALDRLVALVWPARPLTVREARTLLARLDPGLVLASALPAVLADVLVADAADGGVSRDGDELARELLDLPARRPGQLPAEVTTCALAVTLAWWFRATEQPTDDFTRYARDAAAVLPQVDPALGELLASRVVHAVFTRHSAYEHAEVLDAALGAGASTLADRYVERLLRTLDAAEAADVVEVLTAVAHVSGTRPAAAGLLEGRCAPVLGRRKRKTLDEITVVLEQGSVDPRLRPGGVTLWHSWWAHYREQHLDPQSRGVRGHLSRLWGGS